MKIIIFENKKIENLYPITLTRPSFDIMCGGLTLYQALGQVFPEASFDFFVRPYLTKLVERDFHPANVADEQVLFIDGAMVPSITTLQSLAKKIDQGKDFVLKKDGTMVAVYADKLDIYVKFRQDNLNQYLKNLKFGSEDFDCKLFTNLWDPIVYNKEIIKSNLEFISKNYSKHQEGVFIGKDVKLVDQVIFDATNGLIIIDDEVEIDPLVSLRGPLYIGKNTYIKSFADIRSSSIGAVCKIGGEIQETIIQGYTNKGHHGFLGNSYVGKWVNIGGGSSSSDLKNTYGKIKMAGQDTGQIHLGCVIGDYSKTAINTSIFTGKIIGVVSNLYGNVIADVPSFTNHTFDGRLIEYPLDIAEKTQFRVTDRRDVKFDDIDKTLFEDIFEITAPERKKLKVKKGKLDYNIIKGFWNDAGTFDDMLIISNLIKNK